MISNHTMMLDDALQNKLNQNETVELILTDVFEALETKGYNPINQVVGYLIFRKIQLIFQAIKGHEIKFNKLNVMKLLKSY